MDFTIKTYKSLLKALAKSGYTFLPFKDFLKSKSDKTIILRHDVDLLPKNSLRFAKIQAELGIKGSYYFRAVPESWDEDIIKQIAGLGHEVGYHYENMDFVSSRFKVQGSKFKVQRKKEKEKEKNPKFKKGTTEFENLIDLAYKDFCVNLEKLRKLVEVKTICMHGSPRSQFDNKAIWEKYDYKDLGIIGEPYFDVDFDKVFYLTDTGRRWDGWKTSVRDKVPQQEQWIKQGLVFHSTQDIIYSFNKNKMPNRIMFTMHPQRWTDKTLPWAKELIMQNIKNQVKKLIIK